MKAPKRYFWLTAAQRFDNMPAWQVLDILRYDAARVESNAPSGHFLFSSEVAPTVERLETYGVRPVWQTPKAVEAEYGRSLATEFGHELRRKSHEGR